MNSDAHSNFGPISPFGPGVTLAAFGGAGVLLYISTHILIPFFTGITDVEPVIFWFITAGLLVFAPLLIISFVILRNEGFTANPAILFRRLRFRKMTRRDWLWTGASLIVIGLMSAILKFGLESIHDEVGLHPPFMAFEPLGPGRYWILVLWLPFWFLNIMGEEVLWRGVILPRQEISFGRYAWLINAGGWMIFHIAFGWVMLILLIPIIVILPYVTQRTRNTWVAVAIHAGLNGPGFIAVAFGVV